MVMIIFITMHVQNVAVASFSVGVVLPEKSSLL